MTILKNKLNVVLDIGKTNVKLIFLKNKKIVKEYKTKQQNSYFKNSIKTLEANKIVNWLIKKLKKESDKHILNNFLLQVFLKSLMMPLSSSVHYS